MGHPQMQETVPLRAAGARDTNRAEGCERVVTSA